MIIHKIDANCGSWASEAVQKLHDSTVKGLAKSDVQARLATIAVTPAPMNPADLAQFIKVEIAKWAKLVKQAGIEPE